PTRFPYTTLFRSVREEKEQGHGIQGLKSPSALKESLEGDRVIEARLSRSEHEGDTPRSHPLEDRFQPFGMSSQFPNVPALELCPLCRVMVEPATQGRGGRGLFGPEIDLRPLLRQAPR